MQGSAESCHVELVEQTREGPHSPQQHFGSCTTQLVTGIGQEQEPNSWKSSLHIKEIFNFYACFNITSSKDKAILQGLLAKWQIESGY